MTDPFADDLPPPVPTGPALPCEAGGCTRNGFECVYTLQEPGEQGPILCGEHAAEEGFCAACGYFSAGQTGFDFLHPGLCDNCHSESRDDDYDDGYEF